MNSVRQTFLVRCTTTLLEQRDAHFYVHSLCSQQQLTMPERIRLLMFPVQVLNTLKLVVLKYFKMLKEDLKMDDDQESDPFLPKPKLNALKYTRLLINETDTDYITFDKSRSTS